MRALALSGSVIAIVSVGLAVANLPTDASIAAYSTSVAGRTGSQRHNAKLALDRLVGAEIGPMETFSFNERVGSFSQDRGFRKAPVSYNGQLIDDWGGGVCQTSTTLYNAALLAGMEMIERHPHRFAPSYVPPGRDAAVAFSNIDLRFRNPYSFPVRVEGSLTGSRLSIRFVGAGKIADRPQVISEVRHMQKPPTFEIGSRLGSGRVRNTGKEGSDVVVVRIWQDRREIVSRDNYPAMARVIQR